MQRNTGYFPTESLEPSSNRLFSRSALNEGYLFRGSLDTKETLKSMAIRYGMSLTALKDCFKAVYGKPIHAFQREYKMQAATRLLVTTEMSVAEISGRLGYENPNKFSTAFKEVLGLSPSEYRKKRK